VARLDQGSAGSTYVFAAQDGVPVEFALGGNVRGCVATPRGARSKSVQSAPFAANSI